MSRRKQGGSPSLCKPNKRNLQDENILNYKRGGEKPDKLKRLRQLERLRTSNTKITCCDFGVDRERIFPNHFLFKM